jgi:prophage tail gpP-like protein
MSKPIVRNVTTGSELLWRSIKIKKSLDEICHSLELEIPTSERLKVKRHNRLEVRCKNDLVKDSGGERRVTTVLVDEVTSIADVTKNSLMVIGRSPARDIIDSTWSDRDDNFDYNDRKLGEITQNIGNKFGIKCFVFPTNKPDSSDTVPFFAFENESPWTKLTDEADQQGFIFTSNESGDLYLWKVPEEGNITKPFHITEGVNIKSVKWTENGSEQFHEYIVKGGSYDPIKEIDKTCPGNRVLTIDITDTYISEKELKRRAETEMLRRRETKTIVTVPGWGLTNDQIKSIGNTNKREIYWVPNTLIPVKAPSLHLNASLLISEVEYSANAESMVCDITLVNRGMYL